jgi:hypothetical protein
MNFLHVDGGRRNRFPALSLCLVCVLVFSSVSFAQSSWEARYEEIHNMYYNMGQQKEAIQALEDQIASAGTSYSDVILDRILEMLEEYFSIASDAGRFEGIVYDMLEPNRSDKIVNHFRGSKLYDSARKARTRWLRPAAATVSVDKEALDIGESTRYYIKATNQKNVRLSSPDLTVKVTPVDYAKIEGNRLVAVAPGTATLSVSDKDGNVLAERQVTVREGLAVSVSPDYKELAVGESETFVVQSNKPFSKFDISLQVEPKGVVKGNEIPAKPEDDTKRIQLTAEKAGRATLNVLGPEGNTLTHATIYIPPEPPSMLWPLVGSGVTVGLIVYGIIEKGSANSKFDEHEQCVLDGDDPAACQALFDDYESINSRSNIVLILGGVAAAGTGYLWYKYFGDKKEYEKTLSESTRQLGWNFDPVQRQVVLKYNF